MNRRCLKHILLCNPENRRASLFQNALASQSADPAAVVSWRDYLHSPRRLTDLVDDRSNQVLRIDSPGENHHVDCELIARGAQGRENGAASDVAITANEARQLPFDRGRIRYLGQWYRGLQHVLLELEKQLPSCRFYNHPADIALMFDKIACHAALQELGLPVVESIGAVGNLAEILAAMEARNWKRVFIKPAHGSSASGVIALKVSDTGLSALTTVELDSDPRRGPSFYNNLKLRNYSNHPDVQQVVNFICQQRAYVEKWLPKASQDGRNFDLRVMVIDGQARHTVVRSSKHPITNLHLGNRRGDLERLVQQMGEQNWHRAKQVAEESVRVVPRSHAVGVDLLLLPGSFEPKIVELNAFGDLLPNVFHDGLDVWESQIATMVSKYRP